MSAKARAWLIKTVTLSAMGGVFFLLKSTLAEVPSQIEEGEALGILSETAVSRQRGLYNIVSVAYPYIIAIIFCLAFVSFCGFIYMSLL